MKLVATLAVVALGAAAAFMTPRMTEEVVVATVNNTMVKNGQYLVYTDVDTYKVEDTIVYFNYRSSDVWGSLVKGKTYKFTTTYWRLPWLSWYENIVKVEEVK